MARITTTWITDSKTRDWFKRIALSLGGALGVGVLAYLIARAVTSVLLFIQEQQFLSAVSTAVGGDIMALATTNLHEIRLEVQQLDAQNQLLSVRIGFAAALVAAVVLYLWLEKRALAKEQQVE